MNLPRLAAIPALVRVKPGALDRLGIYARRAGMEKIAVFASEGLPVLDRVLASLSGAALPDIGIISDASFENTTAVFSKLPSDADAIFGVGGGKAVDVAKYVAFLSGKPFVAVPASLSNDAFCSPQSSLTLGGRRRSLASAMPYGVVVDTAVCAEAPVELWLSGVGDLVAKLTAVTDWKIAFHSGGTPIDDFAALLSDASVNQFIAHPRHDAEGTRLLATSLLMNGIAMAICGSSRPASGSEHLISHALDSLSTRPRLHGFQVGVATYLVSRLQGRHSDTIDRVFTETGFWQAIAADPFDRSEWIEAIRLAPGVKPNFACVLTTRDCTAEAADLLSSDPQLAACFR